MKYISILLIFALLFSSMGCNRTVLLTENEDIIDKLRKSKEVIVITKDNKIYDLHRPYIYTFENDTIYAHLKLLHISNPYAKNRITKIALNEILHIKFYEVNTELRNVVIVLILGFLIYEVYKFSQWNLM